MNAFGTSNITCQAIHLPKQNVNDMLPFELVLSALNQQYPCRESQIQQLAALYTVPKPCRRLREPCADRCEQPFATPSALVAHGLEATGKSSIVKSVLSASRVPHTVINSRECITGRHLLERTVASCVDALGAASDVDIDRSPYSRCENISALSVHLQRLLEGKGRFVLVFDGIDRQREAPPALLPALARLGEMVCSSH